MSIAETSPAATTGGTGSTRAELLAVDADFLWHPWSPSRVNPDTVLAVSGDGCEIRDADGRTYLDAKSSGLNANLGYGSRPVIDAVAGQLARLMTYDMGEGANEPAIRLAERIAGLTGPRLTRTFFCNSGSEAAEAAIRIARFYHAVRGERQRGLVVSFENAYHGATLGAAASSAGASPVSAEFTPAGFVTLPGRTDALRDFLAGQGDRTAAVLIEPVQARGAHQVPDDRLREVQELCRRYGALLILDEVTTGFGRTGRMFGYQHAGVEPDLLTTSKGLAAGYMSLAAVTTTEHVFDVFDTYRKQAGFVHGHTHSGHAAACAAGLAVLDVIERDGLVANAAARGTQLLAALDGVRGLPFVRDTRGRGLLAAVEFDGSPRASLVRRRMKEDGILVRRTGPNIVIAPPLIIDAGRIDRIAGAFTAAAEAAAGLKTT